MPYWVLGSGLLISVLAFVITLLQTRALTAARRTGVELQTAERRLRRANERFELAASAVSSAIYDLNLQHRTMAWTQGLTELCGYRLDETDPTYEWWIERLHPDDRLRVRERFQTALASGDDFEAEYRFRARDGHYLDVLDRGRFVRDAAGRAVRVVGSMADVSERKRSEAVLRESEARHRAVLETAMDAFVAMDHDGRVIEFNPAAERMFGHPRADVIGRELAEVIIPPAFQDAHRRGLSRYLATGEHTVLGGRIEVSRPAGGRDRVPGGADRDRGADGRAAHLQRLCPGSHRAEARGRGPGQPGDAAPAGAEDGGGGPPRGRRRPRLQQPADRDQRPRPTCC